MIDRLARLLDYLEENIDSEHVKKVEELHCSVLNYCEVEYLPLSVIYPLDNEFEKFPYSEAYDDPEKMLYNELLWSFSSTLNSVRLKDHFPLQIRSNHGIGIISSLFGAKCKIINDNMPWVEHFEDIKEIEKVIEKGMPQLGAGLGGKVLETHKYFMDTLRQYPKCYNAIHITQPDLQGPFDIAHLLVGPQIFYEVYDNPEIIHRLLELITQTYIEYCKYLEPYLTDKAGKNAVYVHGSIYGGRVVIKDDTAAVNLSEEMYNEFSRQYNEKIFEAFDGGTLHHCGQERPWHFSSFYSQNLKGINYGNPEMHDLLKTYEYWSEKKVPIIWWGYNQKADFLKDVYDLKINTGISAAAIADNLDEARNILQRHTERRCVK